MRWLGRLLALLLLLLLGLWLYPDLRDNADRLGVAESSTRDFTFALTREQALEFRLAGESLRLVSNAINAGDAPYYTLQLQWLRGAVTHSSETQSHSVPTGQPFQARFAGSDTVLEASASQLATVPVPAGSTGVRLTIAEDSPVDTLAMRVYVRAGLSVASATREWIRLSGAQRRDLAEASVYPHELLTQSQRADLLAGRWSAMGPLGAEGEDFERVFIYRQNAAPAAMLEEPESDVPSQASWLVAGVYQAFDAPARHWRFSRACTDVVVDWVVATQDRLLQGQWQATPGHASLTLPEGDRLWLRAPESCAAWPQSMDDETGSEPVAYQALLHSLAEPVAFELTPTSERAALRLQLACPTSKASAAVTVQVFDSGSGESVWQGEWPAVLAEDAFAWFDLQRPATRAAPRYLVVPEGNYRVRLQADQADCMVGAETRPLTMLWDQAQGQRMWFPLQPSNPGPVSEWLSWTPDFPEREPADEALEWRSLPAQRACCDRLLLQTNTVATAQGLPAYQRVLPGQSYRALDPGRDLALFYQQADQQARTLSWYRQSDEQPEQRVLSGRFGRLRLPAETLAESIRFGWSGASLQLFAQGLAQTSTPSLYPRYASSIETEGLGYRLRPLTGSTVVLLHAYQPATSPPAVVVVELDASQTHADWQWSSSWTAPRRRVALERTQELAWPLHQPQAQYLMLRYGLRLDEDIAQSQPVLRLRLETTEAESYLRVLQLSTPPVDVLNQDEDKL